MAEENEDKAAADKARHDAEKIEDKARHDAMMDAIKRMDSRLDSFEKEKKDKARHDAAKKDKFGKRKDGESFKDWSKRHDLDMQHMADALRKDSERSEEDCMGDAKDARRDAEEDEKRADKDFEKWAKEEEGEPEHKDKAKKDGEAPEDKKEEKKIEKEEEEEEKPMKDSRKDAALTAENAELRLRLARLEGAMKAVTAETSKSERDALAAAQTRADGVAAMFGDRAPPPIPGETAVDYRKRMVSRFQRHSDRFKGTRLDTVDAATLDLVEDQVFADAVANARAPGDVTPGVLIPYVTRDPAGREITRFHGDVGAFLAPFVPYERQMVRLNTPRLERMN